MAANYNNAEPKLRPVAQSQDRISLLTQWLNTLAEGNFSAPLPASADASFRRYFRVHDNAANTDRIVMDAPPDKEDCSAFIHVTHLLRGVGVNAPAILAQDLAQGFLLLEDLGSEPYLGLLNDNSADRLYADAIGALVRMQAIKNNLPAYDSQRLQTEMGLFETWYLNRHLGVQLESDQQQTLAQCCQLLIDNARQQPQVFVHRDYHSRNLMKTSSNNPGVIDYQDAVIGPISYDLVSLFKDCYIAWPRDRIEAWLKNYLAAASLEVDFKTFLRWFDLMGVQRHLKVLGIFSRLNYRDGKAQYLDDLPLTLTYVVDACERYAELKPLLELLQSCVLKHSPAGD
ncbi:MAG: phosphotransferase [Gammaproteobacteria bacterium]